jgi:hypothetical protein
MKMTTATIMDTKHRNNFILTFFCLAITWIAVVHYDTGVYGFTGAYGFVNNFCDRYAPRIELVVQPPLSDNCLSGEYLSAFTQHHESSSEQLANTSIHAFRLFLKPGCLIDQLSIGQRVVLPLQRIISILHKTNTWHQSSDDDPFPHHSSLS